MPGRVTYGRHRQRVISTGPEVERWLLAAQSPLAPPTNARSTTRSAGDNSTNQKRRVLDTRVALTDDNSVSGVRCGVSAAGDLSKNARSGCHGNRDLSVSHTSVDQSWISQSKHYSLRSSEDSQNSIVYKSSDSDGIFASDNSKKQNTNLSLTNKSSENVILSKKYKSKKRKLKGTNLNTKRNDVPKSDDSQNGQLTFSEFDKYSLLVDSASNSLVRDAEKSNLLSINGKSLSSSSSSAKNKQEDCLHDLSNLSITDDEVSHYSVNCDSHVFNSNLQEQVNPNSSTDGLTRHRDYATSTGCLLSTSTPQCRSERTSKAAFPVNNTEANQDISIIEINSPVFSQSHEGSPFEVKPLENISNSQLLFDESLDSSSSQYYSQPPTLSPEINLATDNNFKNHFSHDQVPQACLSAICEEESSEENSHTDDPSQQYFSTASQCLKSQEGSLSSVSSRLFSTLSSQPDDSAVVLTSSESHSSHSSCQSRQASPQRPHDKSTNRSFACNHSIIQSHKLLSPSSVSEERSIKALLTPTRIGTKVLPPDLKVLHLCNQEHPLPFSSVINQQMLNNCVKIGEGVYGEVFKTKRDGLDVALKIIPIEGNFPVNSEPQKTFAEILSEILISRELSDLRSNETNCTDNFVKVHGISVVRGKYPHSLLKQWDIYHEKKISENDRPDIFKQNQLFIIFIFEDCGTDLESFQFDSAEQSISVLSQVVTSLAVAENELSFEHRDLHWGNVLVKKSISNSETIPSLLDGRCLKLRTSNVKVAIIDFTMSRFSKDGCNVFTDLSEDPTLFTGKGDFQYEVYRLMKDENKNNWEPYNPYTNVLWIHYLADKLVRNKLYSQTGMKVHNKFLRELRTFTRDVHNYNSAMHMLTECSLFK